MSHLSYLLTVLKHKWFVLVAGIFRVSGIPIWRLLIHDWTKFLPREFGPYRRRFILNVENHDEWRIAVNHHYKRNPHHWEYWLHTDGEPLPMPTTFVREMVADWLAAGRAYQGSWNIEEWLSAAYPKMCLHNETKKKVSQVLTEIGIVHNQ